MGGSWRESGVLVAPCRERTTLSSQGHEEVFASRRTTDPSYSPLLAHEETEGGDPPYTLLVDGADAAEGIAREATTSGAGADIVQFSTPIYFADEDKERVSIGVMRLGTAVGRAKVTYYTLDCSARDGEQYEATCGELVFHDGETERHISVPLVNDDIWHATHEFKVCLADPEGCSLDRYLNMARVKVLDDDSFPSSKYEELICQGREGIDAVSGPGLFWEYFKLNFQREGMWWRTALIVIFDQVHNINLLIQTWMALYMVDVVFCTHDADSLKELRFFRDRLSETYFLAALNILPMACIHLWDCFRVKMDVEGHSEAFLRTSLVNRYMNLNEESRMQLDGSRFEVAILDASTQLASGYLHVLDIVKNMGTVSVLTIFSLHTNPGAWWIVLTMPLLMAFFLAFRSAVGEPEDTIEEKKSLLGLLNEMISNYRLIASYCQRPKLNEMVGERVNHLRRKKIPHELAGKHDELFPQWAGALTIGVYMVMEAPMVLSEKGTTSLGTFLTTISIIRDIAGAFSLLYAIYVKLAETFDPLREVTWIFSLRTDLKMWKAVTSGRQQMTRTAMAEARTAETAGQQGGGVGSENVDIALGRVSFHYRPAQPVLLDVSLSAPQGGVVAVSGAHGAGKTTLLRLLGHSLFPSAGHVFVPGHLRILQVDEQVMLFESWSALENLTFGIDRGQIDFKKIGRLLQGLSMVATQDLLEEELQRHPLGQRRPSRSGGVAAEPGEAPWHEVLSAAEKSKICLVRALIANPEVLILHKPLRSFGGEARTGVIRALREHVENRGVGMPGDCVSRRRPRSIFYSVLDARDCCLADVIWHVDVDSHRVTAQQHRKGASVHGEWEPPAEPADGEAVGKPSHTPRISEPSEVDPAELDEGAAFVVAQDAQAGGRQRRLSGSMNLSSVSPDDILQRGW